MGRADEIIADLESGGVMSFSELSGFFFNTPHSDGHTTELTDLSNGCRSALLSAVICAALRLTAASGALRSAQFWRSSSSRGSMRTESAVQKPEQPCCNNNCFLIIQNPPAEMTAGGLFRYVKKIAHNIDNLDNLIVLNTANTCAAEKRLDKRI